MPLDTAVRLWKEVKNFIHDDYDRADAAEAVVNVLLEEADAEEIADAFKFDANIKKIIAEYLQDDDLADDDDDDYY